MNHNVWIYIFVMAFVSFLLRVLPVTLIKKQITNKFIKSILFYLPYVTLSVMTVPAIFYVTDKPLAGIVALIVTCVVAWITSNLFLSAVVASATVYIVYMLLNIL